MDRARRLNADQWKEISPYLDQVLDLEPAAREPRLKELEVTNPALAGDLRELLDTHDAVGAAQFLERSPLSPAAAAVAGQVYGAYTLEAPLGRGETASVWLARRSGGEQEARLAVRILDGSWVGAQDAEQIRHQASALAHESHPNIARVFEAGFGTDGQPFLVMEYVEGVRIDEYCDRHSLSLEGRLTLMLPVIEAVACAHTRGIVHRALKPSNILVSPDGVPKLLDLGIASLISNSATLTAAAIITAPLDSGPDELASRASMPAFAAPEQIRGEAVTAASDVYALGVLLHLLMTQRHPFAADTSTPTQLIRAVLTEDAILTSEAIDSAPSKRWVRGDLDAVIAKAIQREPANRYASGVEFAADLRRFRSGRPVTARPHTWAQRMFMLARRHRFWVPHG